MGLAQDWHVFSSEAGWRDTIGRRARNPHKADDVPLLRIPGLCTNTIMPDPLHTFHLGWGKDLAASSIVYLCQIQVFGRGAMNARLERAFENFMGYCHSCGKTTSIDGLSKLDFDMKKLSCMNPWQ